MASDDVDTIDSVLDTIGGALASADRHSDTGHLWPVAPGQRAPLRRPGRSTCPSSVR
jgi:hypothetical protein